MADCEVVSRNTRQQRIPWTDAVLFVGATMRPEEGLKGCSVQQRARNRETRTKYKRWQFAAWWQSRRGSGTNEVLGSGDWRVWLCGSGHSEGYVVPPLHIMKGYL